AEEGTVGARRASEGALASASGLGRGARRGAPSPCAPRSGPRPPAFPLTGLQGGRGMGSAKGKVIGLARKKVRPPRKVPTGREGVVRSTLWVEIEEGGASHETCRWVRRGPHRRPRPGGSAPVGLGGAAEEGREGGEEPHGPDARQQVQAGEHHRRRR